MIIVILACNIEVANNKYMLIRGPCLLLAQTVFVVILRGSNVLMCVCCVFVDVCSDNNQQKASYFRIKDEEVEEEEEEEVVVAGYRECQSMSLLCSVLSPCHLNSGWVFYFLNYFNEMLHFSVLSSQ